ncbi:MAG: CPBP family intramembrane metalloprotease [Acetatifactor sp.]|nr:CPBP family intramembrane metalloprotease [Acetatifactor sp.]
MTKLLELKKPKMVADAAGNQKGLHIALEILVFVAVFVVCSIAEMIVMTPMELVLLFTNSDYINAIAAGDIAGVQAAANALMQLDAMTIIMLFSNAGIILVTLLFCKLIQKRKVTTVGFQKPGMWMEYLCGMGAGLLIFSVAVLICVVTGSLKLQGLSPSFSIGIFVLFLLGYLVQGMAEEVLCRGYFLVSVSRRYPLAVGIIANAVLFAALHLLNNGITVLAFINLVLFGVFASVYFIKRGNIWGVGALHSIWNLAQGNIYGIRVSGMQTSCSVLSSEMVAGRELINGGDFGLEGGLAVTIVLVAGILILLASRQQRYVENYTDGRQYSSRVSSS